MTDELVGEFIKFTQQLIPYLIMRNDLYNPIYLFVFPFVIRLLTKVINKIYKSFTKAPRAVYIQYFEKQFTHHSTNPVYRSISWFLTNNIDKLKLSQLHCEEYIVKKYDNNNDILNDIEPIYFIGNKDEEDNNEATNEIIYDFRGVKLIIKSLISEKNIGKDVYGRKIFKIMGPNLDIIKEFASHCQNEFQKYMNTQKDEFYHYYEWNEDDKEWVSHQIHTNKTFTNVFLEKDLKSSILGNITNFIDSKEKYTKFGIPYKKGFIFYGKPGCGKTSTIYAIANEFKRNIYMIRLDQLNTGEKLKTAAILIPENSIIVFEDIDSHKITHHRKSKRPIIRPENDHLGEMNSFRRDDQNNNGNGNANTDKNHNLASIVNKINNSSSIDSVEREGQTDLSESNVIDNDIDDGYDTDGSDLSNCSYKSVESTAKTHAVKHINQSTSGHLPASSSDLALNSDTLINKMVERIVSVNNDNKGESVVQYLLSNDNGLFETLLEILDGYNFIPGAIVIITTNYLEKIDSALIRSGRIDQKFLFGNVTMSTIIEIFQFFYDLPSNHSIITDLSHINSINICNGASQIDSLHDLSSAQLINSIILPNLDDAQMAYKMLSNILNETSS